MIRSIFAGTRVEAFEALEKKTEVIKIILTKNSKLFIHLRKKKKYSKKIKLLNKKNKIECFKIIKKTKANVFLSAGFPFIIPIKYFDKKKLMINSHPSYLPSYKGFNPIKESFDNKEIFYGTTLHFIEKKVDCGKIIFQKKIYLKKKNIKDVYKILFSKIEPKVINFGLKKLNI